MDLTYTELSLKILEYQKRIEEKDLEIKELSDELIATQDVLSDLVCSMISSKIQANSFDFSKN